MRFLQAAAVILAFYAQVCFAKDEAKPASRLKISAIHSVTGDTTHISRNGHEIPFFSLPAKQDAKYRFLLQSGLHGNERGAVVFNAWLINRIQSGESPLSKLNEFAAFDFIPIANPDGYLSKQRYNSLQVNLNRNFSILFGKSSENPGTNSFSEPETRAVKAILSKFQYTAAVDIHGYINWVVGPSNPGIFGNQSKYSAQQISDYRKWMQSLEKNMSALPKYELTTAGNLGDGGAFEDWAFWDNQTPAFCLEITANHNPDFLTQNHSYYKYENFLFHMFSAAIQIKNERLSSSDVASTIN